MKYRIDGFRQIEAFYEWVFNNPDKIRPTHVSLYLFLWNQANRSKWVEWFKCPYDLAMQGACIGNNGTYYRCLDELKKWGLIDYKKGINNFKAPLINLFQLYDSEQLTEHVTVPLCEQQTVQQPVQQPVQQYAQQPVHIYNYITNNRKLITDNEKKILTFFESLKSKPKKNVFTPPQISEVIDYFTEKGYSKQAAEKMFEYYSVADWKDSGGKKVRNWKQKANAVWFKDEHKTKSNDIDYSDKTKWAKQSNGYYVSVDTFDPITKQAYLERIAK